MCVHLSLCVIVLAFKTVFTPPTPHVFSAVCVCVGVLVLFIGTVCV